MWPPSESGALACHVGATEQLIMPPKRIFLPTKQLLILSDIHLEKASQQAKTKFLQSLRLTPADTVLITGDISVATNLIGHLEEISRACGNRTLIFCTGNHDYFGSSIKEVDAAIERFCATHPNLLALGSGEIIELSKSTALVGHRGWFDGLAGSGAKTRVESPDRYLIDDFNKLGRSAFFRALGKLGIESADYLRMVLPMALSRYRKVLLATHVPPFVQGVLYDGKGCVWNRQPYFSNRALGKLIWSLSGNFPDRRIEVFAGHTHSAASIEVRPGLSMQVAGAKPGKPEAGKLLTIS